MGAGHVTHVDEHRLERCAAAHPEGRQGVMVGMAVAGQVSERQRRGGRPLDPATGEAARGVAVDQPRQPPCRGGTPRGPGRRRPAPDRSSPGSRPPRRRSAPDGPPAASPAPRAAASSRGRGRLDGTYPCSPALQKGAPSAPVAPTGRSANVRQAARQSGFVRIFARRPTNLYKEAGSTLAPRDWR